MSYNDSKHLSAADEKDIQPVHDEVAHAPVLDHVDGKAGVRTREVYNVSRIVS